jgi:hypothetical protein
LFEGIVRCFLEIRRKRFFFVLLQSFRFEFRRLLFSLFRLSQMNLVAMSADFLLQKEIELPALFMRQMKL